MTVLEPAAEQANSCEHEWEQVAMGWEAVICWWCPKCNALELDS